jgi:hypothetical protein
VTDRDPLATPTLARLYMGQGHFDRARTVLDGCLRRDPHDGHALALVRRLQVRSDATLVVKLVRDRLVLEWTALADAESCYVVIVASTQTGSTAATWVTSTRARAAFGTWDHGLPFPRGSVSACIGTVGPHGWSVLAVARPLSWPV